MLVQKKCSRNQSRSANGYGYPLHSSHVAYVREGRVAAVPRVRVGRSMSRACGVNSRANSEVQKFCSTFMLRFLVLSMVLSCFRSGLISPRRACEVFLVGIL